VPTVARSSRVAHGPEARRGGRGRARWPKATDDRAVRARSLLRRRWRSGWGRSGGQALRWAVLAERFFELRIATTADPFQQEPDFGSVPVLVGIPCVRLANDLERAESSGRNIDDLGAHHRKRVVVWARSRGVFIGSPMTPLGPHLERPAEPRLRWCHPRLDFSVSHAARPPKVSGIELLELSDLHKVEGYFVDFSDLQNLYALRPSGLAAGPRVAPLVPGTPLGRRAGRDRLWPTRGRYCFPLHRRCAAADDQGRKPHQSPGATIPIGHNSTIIAHGSDTQKANRRS